MPISYQEVISAAKRMAQQTSIPLREPATARPTFWSPCLAQTRTRPIPANSGWLNINTLVPGVGIFPSNYSCVVNQYIATSQAAMSASGLLYRFLVEGDMMPSQYFQIAAGVDYNVERVGTTNPFPSQPRKIFITLSNNQHLALQVNNTSGSIQQSYSALFGWFFPNLGGENKTSFEGSGFNQTDTVRDYQPPYGPSY